MERADHPANRGEFALLADRRSATSPTFATGLRMLRHLSIRHFALIDRLELPLHAGFLAITGETGAGKSIVLDAVELLAGGRATTDVVRSGEEEAVLQGLFEPGPAHRERVDAVLAEAGLPSEDTLLVRRVISRSGSNRVYVNDALATASLLQRLVAPMVEIVGQHAQLTLTRPDTHRRLIDRFGAYPERLEGMAAAHAGWRAAAAELERLEEARAARAERLEYLRFQKAEIEALQLREGEYEELARRLGRARNLGRIGEAVERARERAYDGDNAATDALSDAVDALRRVEDPELESFAERLDEALVIVQDVGRELAGFSLDDDGDDDLDAMESRHEALRSAMKRFAMDEAGLLERLAELTRDVGELENFEEAWEAAERRERDALAAAHAAARSLAASRTSAAEAFFREATELLGRLGMPHARLELASTPGERAPTRFGYEPVEIGFSANPGEALAPIGRVASGGELSRLLLALKTVAMKGDPVATYIFDEVDAGIGGETAEVVARMLVDLSAGRQVLCVTHLAAIAARGHEHRHVTKRVVDGRTYSEMVDLGGDRRVEEIARMVGGAAITDATLAHARELLAGARA